jgi:RimJ/RimL family protein N-acetyltransferase
MNIIKIKKYNEKISKFLFNLRNKKFVRDHSVNKKKITYKNHKIWFYNFIKNKKNNLYLAQKNKIYIGYLSSKKNGKFFVLSWALMKSFHKRGLAFKLLKKTTNNNQKRFKAVIKNNNYPSIKIAIKSGFKKKSKKKNLFFFYK